MWLKIWGLIILLLLSILVKKVVSSGPEAEAEKDDSDQHYNNRHNNEKITSRFFGQNGELLRSKEIVVINDLMIRIFISTCSFGDLQISEYLSLELLPLKNFINKQILLASRNQASDNSKVSTYPSFLSQYNKLLKCQNSIHYEDTTTTESSSKGREINSSRSVNSTTFESIENNDKVDDDVNVNKTNLGQSAAKDQSQENDKSTTIKPKLIPKTTTVKSTTKRPTIKTRKTTRRPKTTTTTTTTTTESPKKAPVSNWVAKTYKKITEWTHKAWKTVKGWFSSSSRRSKRSIEEEDSEVAEGSTEINEHEKYLQKLYKDLTFLINDMCYSTGSSSKDSLDKNDEFLQDIESEIVKRMGSIVKSSSKLEPFILKHFQDNKLPQMFRKCFQNKNMKSQFEK